MGAGGDIVVGPVFLTWKGDGIPCLLGGGRELGPKAQDRKEHTENNYKPYTAHRALTVHSPGSRSGLG